MKDNARNARNFVISWIIATGILLIGMMGVSLNAFAASASNMTDIPSGSWYESAVQYCLNNNYMSGESDTKFNPNGTVSRAQMVQVLYNLEGQPGYTSGHTPPVPGTTTPYVGVRKTASPAAPARRPSSPTLPLPESRSLRSLQITPNSRTTIPALRAI